jgi:heme/copper-type cytochrome/quinol oxidase subunit 4
MSQPTPLPIPKSAVDDAKQRALRTWAGGLIVAILLAVLPVLDAAAGNIQWSSAFWVALGNAVVTPAVSAAVSYVQRHLSPPA